MRRYNLSKIMRRAHYLRRKPFAPSFSSCLKKAWEEAKFSVRERESIEKRKTERKQSSYDYRLNRTYYGVRMGRDDWKRDYQNDIKVAVKRSIQLNCIRANAV